MAEFTLPKDEGLSGQILYFNEETNEFEFRFFKDLPEEMQTKLKLQADMLDNPEN